MRFFINKFVDFANGSDAVVVDRGRWTRYVTEVVDLLRTRLPPKPENCDGGLYVGCAGVAYALYRIAMAEPFLGLRDRLLALSVEYVDVALAYADNRRSSSRDPPAAFFLGPGGVLVAGSLVYEASGRSADAAVLLQRYAQLAAVVSKPGDFLGFGSDELFVGRAGYLCGALTLNETFRSQVIPAALMIPVCRAIVDSGRQYSKRHRSPCPLMYSYYDTEYLGAAHGISTILQMLLSVPEFLASDKSAEQDIHKSVDFLLTLVQANGNIPPAMDDVNPRAHRRSDSDELVHWCHGAPGIIYLFVKAHLRWPDDGRYLSVCHQFAEVTWQRGLLKKGPGICHGVAGSGYVFLLMHRLTGDQRYLHRANKFAEFLQDGEFLSGARTPDCPWSLYEGLAGTLCFVTDLMQPDKAEFPFFNVFG